GAGGQCQVGGRVPRWQGQGLQRAGGSGHEGHQGQGQSGRRERAAEEKAGWLSAQPGPALNTWAGPATSARGGQRGTVAPPDADDASMLEPGGAPFHKARKRLSSASYSA